MLPIHQRLGGKQRRNVHVTWHGSQHQHVHAHVLAHAGPSCHVWFVPAIHPSVMFVVRSSHPPVTLPVSFGMWKQKLPQPSSMTTPVMSCPCPSVMPTTNSCQVH